MKVASLHDLITDSKDVLDFFQDVHTPDQLISRLERLKRQKPDDLDDMLACLEGLRGSVNASLEDTLEMSASLDEPDNESDLDAELDALGSSDESDLSENQNLPASDAVEEEKNNKTSAS